MPTTNRYYAYVRVSTTKQGEKGVSLQEQKEAIERYADRNDLTVIEWFEERVTAAKKGRKEFGHMLTQLRRGKADGVLMHKIDRSARNLRDWADLGELIDAGIDVQFANESLDLTSRGGRLSADIQAVVAADFIRNLREETRKGFYGRLKQGYYPLQAPIGYLDCGGGKKKKFDPERAPIVRRLFELYATGQHTLQSLVKEAEIMGLTNRRGGKLSRSGLSTILNNTFYIGIICIKSTDETFQGNHEPLVSTRLFQRVQSILQGKTNTKIQKYDFLFRRMIQCQLCGYSIVGERQKGHVYYRCHTKNCPTTGVREERVEATVADCLAPLDFDASEWSMLTQTLEEFNRRGEDERRRAIEAYNLQLAQLGAKLQRLVDALLDELIDKDTFELRKADLLKRQREVKDRVEVLQHGRNVLITEVTNIFELAGTAKKSYNSATLEDKRELLQTITSNRSLNVKKLQFERSYPFQYIAERSQYYSCLQHRTKSRIWDAIIDELVGYVTRTNNSSLKK